MRKLLLALLALACMTGGTVGTIAVLTMEQAYACSTCS
jgi:hypothetical protein